MNGSEKERKEKQHSQKCGRKTHINLLTATFLLTIVLFSFFFILVTRNLTKALKIIGIDPSTPRAIIKRRNTGLPTTRKPPPRRRQTIQGMCLNFLLIVPLSDFTHIHQHKQGVCVLWCKKRNIFVNIQVSKLIIIYI